MARKSEILKERKIRKKRRGGMKERIREKIWF